MTRVFVSGSTGFIGQKLSLRLAGSGFIVHALYRDTEKARVLNHPNIKLFRGDILDPESIYMAMKDCEQVYHVAAFTDVWVKKEEIIYGLNVTGTENILKTALALKIKKMVFTSTAGVLGPSLHDIVDEKTKHRIGYFLEYERTKAIAEEKVLEFVLMGLNCVIVNPTRVYGPGPFNKSNSVTLMIKSFFEGKWRLIPGNGKSIGNYVYIDDVVNGHLLAMLKGTAGERYILGGANVSYSELFETLAQLTGKRRVMIRFPLFLMLILAKIMLLWARLFRVKPLITPALVKKFNYNWNVSSEKAVNELEYSHLPFEKGALLTLEWIKKQAEIKF